MSKDGFPKCSIITLYHATLHAIVTNLYCAVSVGQFYGSTCKTLTRVDPPIILKRDDPWPELTGQLRHSTDPWPGSISAAPCIFIDLRVFQCVSSNCDPRLDGEGVPRIQLQRVWPGGGSGCRRGGTLATRDVSTRHWRRHRATGTYRHADSCMRDADREPRYISIYNVSKHVAI